MKVLIDKRLKELNMSRTWLAELSNISINYINYLCDPDVKEIQLDKLEKICEVLKCGVGCILISDKDYSSYLDSDIYIKSKTERNKLMHDLIYDPKTRTMVPVKPELRLVKRKRKIFDF